MLNLIKRMNDEKMSIVHTELINLWQAPAQTMDIDPVNE